MTTSLGHRERLRRRFLADADQLSPAEQLELLLTYAIPRQDVAPLSQTLLTRFGSLDGVLHAKPEELLQVAGVGETTAVLIQLVAHLGSTNTQTARLLHGDPLKTSQPTLFSELELPPPEVAAPKTEMRAFVNDEIATSLEFIPQAGDFADYDSFKAFLNDRLPYNSVSTRKRRANHIVARFYPDETLDVPLTDYASRFRVTADLYPVIFYHVLQAEPLVARLAEELVWAALPVGYVTREEMRLYVLRYLPDISLSSQKNVLLSLFNTYGLLGVSVKDKAILRLQVGSGTLPAFLYILTAVFPQPGIYSFDALEQGPMRRWLLWDREWMRRQLYNLRDLGVISKISEIDAMRQFTLAFDQRAALRHYYDHPRRSEMALRETAVTETSPP
jgi:hypothetical protein